MSLLEASHIFKMGLEDWVDEEFIYKSIDDNVNVFVRQNHAGLAREA